MVAVPKTGSSGTATVPHAVTPQTTSVDTSKKSRTFLTLLSMTSFSALSQVGSLLGNAGPPRAKWLYCVPPPLGHATLFCSRVPDTVVPSGRAGGEGAW